MAAIRIAGTWRTTAPVDAVWSVVEDLGTWPRWWPAIQEVVPVGDASAEFTFDTPAPLRPLTVTLTIVERQPASHLLAQATDGPIDGTATLDLATEGDATTIGFQVRLRFRSLLFRPLEAVLAGATRAGGKERLRQAGDDLAELAGGEPLDHDL